MLKSRIKQLSMIYVLSLLILSCWGDSSPTSDKIKSYTVGGKVTDKNGTGIKDVLVLIEGTNFSTAKMTDSGGTFYFEGIKSGDYKVKALKDSCFFRPADIALSGVKIRH